jgi:AbrB family looped-hinge helix DNA binding protein
LWDNLYMAHRTTKPTETETYVLPVGERGRVVLPAKVRKRLRLNAGDRMVLNVDKSGDMRLASLKRKIEKGMGMFADLQPHRIASEELIAERREEQRREDLE